MSTAPQFATTLNVGSGAVSATADTGWTSPTHTTDIITGGTNGTKVEELVFQGIGVTLAGMVNVWLYDGATHYLVDQVKFVGVSGSTTLTAERFVRQYSNLFVKSGWKLRVSSMVASQLVNVTGYGGDF